MYKKILVAYDFDNTFKNVPQELVRLTSGSQEAEITVFNVISESELQTSVITDVWSSLSEITLNTVISASCEPDVRRTNS